MLRSTAESPQFPAASAQPVRAGRVAAVLLIFVLTGLVAYKISERMGFKALRD